MAEFVYGIVGGSARAPSGKGIADAPLLLVSGDGVAALVSDLPDQELRMGREEVMAHARVLEAALSQGTVLPMRFGVVMEGPEAVREGLLDRYGDELRGHLERLEGKVEINIRAIYEDDALMREVVLENPEVAGLRKEIAGKPEDATYYERIRLGELVAAAVERKREHDGRVLLDVIAPFALEVEVGEPPHERVALSASFLVGRDRLKDFDDAVEGLAQSQANRIRIKYTGPLPPHSFVELAGAA